jgi:hypothetical protein
MDLWVMTLEEAETHHRRIMADYRAEPVGVRDAHSLAGALARLAWYAQHGQVGVAHQATALPRRDRRRLSICPCRSAPRDYKTEKGEGYGQT